MIAANEVAIYRDAGCYSHTQPYHPAANYPEYPFTNSAVGPKNPAYAAVRGALSLLFEQGFGTTDWNPLQQIVRPGDTVVLKPNFIRDFHDARPDDIECVVTHGSVIRAVLDYVNIALGGAGNVIIADAPQCEASFERLKAFTGLDEIQSFYADNSSLKVDIIDLRPEYTLKVDGVIVGHKRLAGDPSGYTTIDLGRASEFIPINHMNRRLYGSEYDRSEVAAHHHDNVHEYLISRTILDADVFISIAKMKTHKKTGVTLNLKNLVGINGNKNWLPHHREGVPADGGDQYAASGHSERLEQVLLASFKKWFPMLGPLRRYVGGAAKRVGRLMFGDTNGNRIRSGNWWGNDTTWRMVLDLNRALRYGDGAGRLHDGPQRRYMCFVDGVVGGEGNGPMGPDPRPEGLIVAGVDPLAVDLVCTRVMGFDFRRIPVLYQATKNHRFSLLGDAIEGLRALSNVAHYNRLLCGFEGSCLAFEPHHGWAGHIAIGDSAPVGV